MVDNCIDILRKKGGTFTRGDIITALKEQDKGKSTSTYNNSVKELIDSNKIARVGRDRYCIPNEGSGPYFYNYSDFALTIKKIIQKKYPNIDYRIFELLQLNEFLNHQIAHNAVFISVESDYGDFIFDALKRKYPGRVLFRPTENIYYLYWQDNLIIVTKLVTESPKDEKQPWSTPLEKMLVDIYRDKLIRSTYSEAEFPDILEEAFKKYTIDESSMFRYAKRRHAYEKIMSIAKDNQNISLRSL